MPAGTIAGVVRDRSGGAIAGAKAQAVSRATGAQRTTTSGEHGEYSFPALLTGEYEVSVDAAGFNHVSRAVTVESGTTTRADVILDVGSISDLVTVQSASVQLHRDSATVGGLITHDQIEGLPLNGRGFLELAKLEPGLQLPSSANRNRTVVPVLSAPGSNIGGVRVTVDGGSVTSIGLGGSQMGFSQEAVQQFQVSTVNFDLSAGMTHAGVINIVTRSGSNALHAAAFYFFRHHSLSAYPALTRDQDDPDPYFQRQQFGFALGGPIRRNRLFYFANWERNDQRAVAATTLLAPDFAHFSLDFNGDGTTDDLLPGTTVNAFNRRMGRSDLERLVDDFNRTYAGSRDSHGAAIPRLTLPAVYSFDDNFHTLDIRLSRSIPIRHGVRLAIIGEAFNVYNASNLSGYSGDLTSASFGQPTSRLAQTFGSGGPRSFQLAARMGF